MAREIAIEQRTHGDFADSISFLGQAAPAFLIAALANGVWILWALVTLLRRKSAFEFLWLGIAVAFWAVTRALTALWIRQILA